MKKFIGLTLALMILPALFQGVSSQDNQGLIEQQRLEDRFEGSQTPKSRFDDDSAITGESMDRAEAAQYRFTFKSIKFPGMTLYDAYDMRPLYEEMLGAEISLAEILDLAKLIEQKYAEDGYTAARVMLTKRPDSGGKVSLLVIEKH